jgi:predicted ATP-grasp superfamily ATP-dependent carboligase
MSARFAFTPSLPVLIFQRAGGAFQHGVLGIVRSLGRLGVRVHLVHQDERTAAAVSRYCRGGVVHCPADAPDDVALERLVEFGRRHGPAILIPTDDESVLLVEAHAAELRTCFRFPAQPERLAESLSSKREMARLCAEHDVPTPWTHAILDREDLVARQAGLTFPAMVKSIDGARTFRRTGERMRIVEDAPALLRAYDELEDPELPNLLIQEYIPGGPESVWMLNGYFDADSECRLAVTGRKLRQLPPYTGVTTLGICVPNPDVEELTRRFMKSVGYRGVLDIGYRYDARDGRYKLLDVNPRVGATFRLFACAGGIDVVHALYLDLTGQAIPPGRPQWGRKWLVENFDAAASLSYRRDGRLAPRDWLSSLRGIDELSWFAADDPAPFVRMGLAYLQRLSPRPAAA